MDVLHWGAVVAGLETSGTEKLLDLAGGRSMKTRATVMLTAAADSMALLERRLGF
jgi:hypothetical protein